MTRPRSLILSRPSVGQSENRETAFVGLGLRFPRLLLLFWISSHVFLLVSNAHAQGKRTKSEERREADRIQDAERAVKSAKQDFQEVNKEFAQAAKKVDDLEARVQRLLADVRRAREAAEDKLEESTGIPAARSKLEAARKAFDELAKPLREKFAETSEYQEAQKQAEVARETILELRKDLSLDESERTQQIEKWVKLLHRHENLQAEFVLNDPAAKASHDAVEKLHRELVDLQKKVESRIESQPEVKNAVSKWAQAKKDLEAQQKSLAAVRREGEQKQAKLSQANNRLQAAKNANREDDARDRQRKP